MFYEAGSELSIAVCLSVQTVHFKLQNSNQNNQNIECQVGSFQGAMIQDGNPGQGSWQANRSGFGHIAFAAAGTANSTILYFSIPCR